LVVAAPGELRAVLRGLGAARGANPEPWAVVPCGGRLDLVLAGVGKANAAGAAARAVDAERHGLVVSLGIGGALPTADSEPAVGEAVAGVRSVFGDEGLATPGGFVPCREIGFPVGVGGSDGVPAWTAAVDAARGVVEHAAVIATVSACSATDAGAQDLAERSGAVIEAMEGAAVGLVAARCGVPFVELRVVSNTTGDRDGQRWDLELAFERLARLARDVAGDPAKGNG
jgi:futalosine hydrolase